MKQSKTKNQVVRELATFGVIVCRPEEKNIEELCAVLDIFLKDMKTTKRCDGTNVGTVGTPCVR